MFTARASAYALSHAVLVRVTGPGFTAGLVFGQDHRVVKAAPILRWVVGLTSDELRAERVPTFAPNRDCAESRLRRSKAKR
jgi:hypothetical protein